MGQNSLSRYFSHFICLQAINEFLLKKFEVRLTVFLYEASYLLAVKARSVKKDLKESI